MSPRLARFGAALLAAFVVFGTYRWAQVARDLFQPGLVCEGCLPGWYRSTQLVLAVVGIGAAVVVMAYLAHFVITGRIWRRWRGVAMTFGALAASWAALWWILSLPQAMR